MQVEQPRPHAGHPGELGGELPSVVGRVVHATPPAGARTAGPPRPTATPSAGSPLDREYRRPVNRSGRQGEQRALAAELRGRGVPLAGIAAALRERYGVNARLAVRLARGWTQADVAAAWTRRWPDDPKTFKNVSY